MYANRCREKKSPEHLMKYNRHVTEGALDEEETQNEQQKKKSQREDERRNGSCACVWESLCVCVCEGDCRYARYFRYLTKGKKRTRLGTEVAPIATGRNLAWQHVRRTWPNFTWLKSQRLPSTILTFSAYENCTIRNGRCTCAGPDEKVTFSPPRPLCRNAGNSSVLRPF